MWKKVLDILYFQSFSLFKLCLNYIGPICRTSVFIYSSSIISLWKMFVNSISCYYRIKVGLAHSLAKISAELAPQVVGGAF